MLIAVEKRLFVVQKTGIPFGLCPSFFVDKSFAKDLSCTDYNASKNFF